MIEKIEKFDVTTFFRTVIPGYIFLLVLYTLKPEWFTIELRSISGAALLALLGIPIGYIAQEIYRFFYYAFKCESRLDQKDRKRITAYKKLCNKGDETKKKFSGEDNFYYSTIIDYLLFTNKEFEDLNEHLRFLYTRMHSYGASAVAILEGIVLFIVFNPICFTSKYKWLIIWIILAILLMKTKIATAKRISLWRRQIIDRNESKIKDLYGIWYSKSE